MPTSCTPTPRATKRCGLLVTAAVLWGTVGLAGRFPYDRTEVSPTTVGF